MAVRAETPKATIGSRILDRQVAQLHRRLAAHMLYSRYVDEIPEPMFRQLVSEGLFRAKVFCLGAAAFFLLPSLAAGNPIALIFVIVVGTACYYCWPWLIIQGVERELLYRHREGKWRWER
ncbi:hypothetical protein [Dongia sp.]|uniref:hypothetical protein n=1 Tax=Dongia sp. TaxID=1977262 RepID=UPI00375175D5